MYPEAAKAFYIIPVVKKNKNQKKNTNGSSIGALSNIP